MKFLSVAGLCCLAVGVVQAAPRDPALKKVSKKISIGRYKPSDLVPFDDIMVSRRIVPDLRRLIKAALRDGIKLRACSGYRSYERQKALFASWSNKERKKNPKLTKAEAEKLANQYSAKPGHSEHQLGTTVDILSSENNYQFSSDKSLKYVGWLEKNAPKYNFKISFKEDSDEFIYEPWHIRWYP